MAYPQICVISPPDQRQLTFFIEFSPTQRSINTTIDLRDRWPLPPYFSTNPSPDTRAMTRGELETLQQEYTVYKNRIRVLESVKAIEAGLGDRVFRLCVPKLKQGDLDLVKPSIKLRSMSLSMHLHQNYVFRSMLPAFWVDGFVVKSRVLTEMLRTELGFSPYDPQYAYAHDGQFRLDNLFNSSMVSTDEGRVVDSDVLREGRWIKDRGQNGVRLANSWEEARAAAAINRQYPAKRYVVELPEQLQNQPTNSNTLPAPGVSPTYNPASAPAIPNQPLPHNHQLPPYGYLPIPPALAQALRSGQPQPPADKPASNLQPDLLRVCEEDQLRRLAHVNAASLRADLVGPPATPAGVEVQHNTMLEARPGQAQQQIPSVVVGDEDEASDTIEPREAEGQSQGRERMG